MQIVVWKELDIIKHRRVKPNSLWEEKKKQQHVDYLMWEIRVDKNGMWKW